MSLLFEWDERKSRDNLRKHGVSFQEAKTVFNDPLAITIYDPDHSIAEDRYIDLGLSSNGRCLVVSYADRGEKIRIISGRVATRRERRKYDGEER
ncbi:MAG: BrnT family toxin [Gemmatimonadota bacterium]|nr:BrnT family toxin [Gemmatimonadota bacterium]